MNYAKFLVAGALILTATSWQTFAGEAAQLGEILVSAQETPSRGTTIAATDGGESRSINAGQAASSIPGVSAVTRGADAAEPVIRGLGWERVETQVGCLSLYGACPSRMDPPATYIGLESVSGVNVIKALPSVTLGPGGTGGRVIVSMDQGSSVASKDGASADGKVTWNEGRDGYVASIAGGSSAENLDVRAEASRVDLGDYKSAGGITVPANVEEYGGSATLTWRPNDVSAVSGSYIFKEIEGADYPALPMDTIESTVNIITLGYEREMNGKYLEALAVEAGYSDVDHVMNNKNKPNRSKLHAETPSEARAFSSRVATDWRTGDDSVLTAGVDYEHLERDAVRTRRMVSSGATFKDHLWPDAERGILGGFGEWTVGLSDDLSVRAGTRIDYAESEAKAVDDTVVLGGGSPPSTIRDSYVRFYGADAGETDQDDILVSGNILAEYQANEATMIYAGIGKSSRYPSITEQYFAFGAAPGGYQVGNPSLDPEEKYEVSAGVQFGNDKVKADVSVFAARVQDYIYQTRIDRLDVNGDGVLDNLKGFRNVDAELYGGEVSAVVQVTESLSVPVTLAYVRGRNTIDDTDLPETPPLEGSAALKYEATGDRPWWCEAGLRFAARQSRVDDMFPEDETSSFEAFHLKGGIQIAENLEIELGVENLFDEEYNEHLTREAMLPAGDLAAGDEVPAPGRYFYLTAKYSM